MLLLIRCAEKTRRNGSRVDGAILTSMVRNSGGGLGDLGKFRGVSPWDGGRNTMMPKRLERLIVKGYKSIKETDLPLGQINVLIGANGAGKSNLIEVFQFLHQVAQQDLQITVAQMGGADQLLHFGRKTTEWMEITLWFAMREHLANGYSCRLVPTSHDSLIIAEECLYFHDRSRLRATTAKAPPSGATPRIVSAGMVKPRWNRQIRLSGDEFVEALSFSMTPVSPPR